MANYIEILIYVAAYLCRFRSVEYHVYQHLFFAYSIATRFNIFVINYKRDDNETKMLTPKEDGLMSVDTMCAVSNEEVSVPKRPLNL